MKNLLNPIVEATQEMLVRYVYKCRDCGHRGVVNLAGDGHENDVSECEVCCSAVTMEWDGGVVMEVSLSARTS